MRAARRQIRHWRTNPRQACSTDWIRRQERTRTSRQAEDHSLCLQSPLRSVVSPLPVRFHSSAAANCGRGKSQRPSSNPTSKAPSHSPLRRGSVQTLQSPTMNQPAPSASASMTSGGTGGRKAPIEPGTVFYTYEDIGACTSCSRPELH